MRTKRVDKFRRHRFRKGRNLVLFAILIPCASVLIGYLLTSLVILPVISK